jgi:hypothetical protein
MNDKLRHQGVLKYTSSGLVLLSAHIYQQLLIVYINYRILSLTIRIKHIRIFK